MLRITYLGHASLLIEIDGVKVITDPLLRPRIMRVLRRVAPEATEE
jgi:L-ascorbate metabolism protein UlaG (beta-lactamase superfamily)